MSLKLKHLLYKRHCKEKEQTNHRLEKIFANDISGKRAKIQKEIVKLNNKKTNDLVKKKPKTLMENPSKTDKQRVTI